MLKLPTNHPKKKQTKKTIKEHRAKLTYYELL